MDEPKGKELAVNVAAFVSSVVEQATAVHPDKLREECELTAEYEGYIFRVVLKVEVEQHLPF